MISCDNLAPSAPAIGLDVDVDASISEAALPVNFCGILPTDGDGVAQIEHSGLGGAQDKDKICSPHCITRRHWKLWFGLAELRRVVSMLLSIVPH
jgi:hypothetical protein